MASGQKCDLITATLATALLSINQGKFARSWCECDDKEKRRRSGAAQLLGHRTRLSCDLTAEQSAVEFFYQLDEFFRILFATCGFRENTPILRLSFHAVTSVVAGFRDDLAFAVPRRCCFLFCVS